MKNKLLKTILCSSLYLFTLMANAQDALYPIQQGGKYGFINKAGKLIVEPQYTFADQFMDGLAAV